MATEKFERVQKSLVWLGQQVGDIPLSKAIKQGAKAFYVMDKYSESKGDYIETIMFSKPLTEDEFQKKFKRHSKTLTHNVICEVKI